MEQRLGNYHLTHLLGSGGFADVYYGEHLYLKTSAAIKVLRVKIMYNEHKKFLAEAQIAARLEHPHIVSVLEFGIQQHTIPYLVMDYAANGTLRQWYPKGTQLTTTQILPIVEHVASALDYTHQQQVIHRDVKPENMLLNSKNDILLSDFGIALVVQNAQRFDVQRHVVGTMAYMAPEQLRGEPCPASDQYSLAAVIYEWLCGEPPFTGSYTEMAIQHALVPPVPLRKRLPHLALAIEEVIMIALAKEPQARFRSIKAFATAFKQVCTVQQDSAMIERQDNASLQHDALEAMAEAHSPKKHSRRTFTIGLGLLGGIGLLAGGPLAWKFLLHRSLTPPFVQQPTQVPHLAPGTTLCTYHGHMFASYIAWSHDSKRIASADDNVQIWEATTGKLVLLHRRDSDQNPFVNVAMAWAPNGSWIASAYTDGQIQVWDANTGKTLYAYNRTTSAHSSLAWSPESERIAAADKYVTPYIVQVWKATTGELLTTYSGHTAGISSLAWSPDGKYVASAQQGISEQDGGTVYIWDAVTGSSVLVYSEHTDWVNAVAWSPDGKYIASASGKIYNLSRQNDRTVRIWEAASGKTLLTYREHTENVATVVWSPNGKYIASGDSLSSVNGKYVSSGGAAAKIWDATTGKTLLTYRGHTRDGDNDGVVALAWSPDGGLIASVGADGTVQVWKAVL